MGKIKNNYRLSTVYHSVAQSLPLLHSYQYIVEFVGGGGYYIDQDFKQFTLFDKDENNPDQNFAYWVKSGAEIPNFDIAKSTIKFYSTEFRMPACRTYGHDLTLTLMVDNDLTFYHKLDTWLKMISRLKIDGGGVKTIPTVKMRIMLLDADHTHFQDSFVYEGVWITKLGDLSGEYNNGSAAPVDLQASFKYQYAYRDPDLDLLNDPLSTAKILAAVGEVN